MSQLVYAVAVLACPAGMGAMMWVMMRAQRGDNRPSHGPAGEGGDPNVGPNIQAKEAELARLRAQIDQLQAERDADRTDADRTRLGKP